jgi:type I restriction enzyme R subunit
MKLTENELEKVFIELLEQEGYAHSAGASLPRSSMNEVLIEEDLRSFLLSRYKSDKLTENELSSIIQQLKSLSSNDLYESNKRFMQMLSNGFILKRDDHKQKDIYIEFIDYRSLEKNLYLKSEKATSLVAENNEDNNIYRFVTQLKIEGN